jgi:hypothetical protein
MIKVIAAIYSTVHQIMIVVGTIALAIIGGLLGNSYGYQIVITANSLFGWKMSYNNTTFIGVIIGLIAAFAFYGREAMILETYEATKEIENKLSGKI